jgi:hypothetical protein
VTRSSFAAYPILPASVSISLVDSLMLATSLIGVLVDGFPAFGVLSPTLMVLFWDDIVGLHRSMFSTATRSSSLRI